ncbi:MAG: hypothetical protein ACFFEF_06510, partial [Candidatus Thorarchaeota archaeon]
MDPLGTITKYYPFLEKEIQTILDSLMKESTSYYDFVHRLAQYVLENEGDLHLAYLAAVHVSKIRETELIQDIATKYSNTHHVKLWGYRPGLELDSPGLIGPSQSGDRMDRFNREVMEA